MKSHPNLRFTTVHYGRKTTGLVVYEAFVLDNLDQVCFDWFIWSFEQKNFTNLCSRIIMLVTLYHQMSPDKQLFD